jgi:hypothetical protein
VLTVAAKLRDFAGVLAVFAAVLAERAALGHTALTSGMRALFIGHMRRSYRLSGLLQPLYARLGSKAKSPLVSPQAGHEALGNALRILAIAWQFRREHAIF